MLFSAHKNPLVQHKGRSSYIEYIRSNHINVTRLEKFIHKLPFILVDWMSR